MENRNIKETLDKGQILKDLNETTTTFDFGGSVDIEETLSIKTGGFVWITQIWCVTTKIDGLFLRQMEVCQTRASPKSCIKYGHFPF